MAIPAGKLRRRHALRTIFLIDEFSQFTQRCCRLLSVPRVPAFGQDFSSVFPATFLQRVEVMIAGVYQTLHALIGELVRDTRGR